MSDFDWFFYACIGVGALAVVLTVVFIGLAISVFFEKVPGKKLATMAIAILTLATPRLFGAFADPLSLIVESNGAFAQLQIAGLGTNGWFYNGFLSNNVPSKTNGMTITVSCPGYSSQGVTNTGQRTIYGTMLMRLPYPKQLTNDAQSDGSGGVLARISLSQHIYAADTISSCVIRAGAYAVTNGTGTNCNAATLTGASITNNSLAVYQKPSCLWEWNGFNVLSSNCTMRVAGGSAYGIAAIRVVAADTNSFSVTNWQTKPQIDHSIPDKTPGVEYIFPLNLSGMSNGSPVRFDFTVYPIIGTNLLDTMDNVNHYGPLYSSQTNIYDSTGGIYCRSVAIVATNGNNSTAVVTTNFSAGALPLPFLDMGAARNAIRLTNSVLFGHTDPGGGLILLSNGQHSTFVTAPTQGTIGLGMLRIFPFPGLDRSSVSITGALNYIDNDRIHCSNIFINSSATFGWAFEKDLVFEQCAFNETTTTYFQAVTNIYFLQCRISNMVNGFFGQSSKIMTPNVIRGNDLTGQGAYAGLMYNVFANGADKPVAAPFVNRFYWVTSTSGGLQVNPDGMVFMCNKFLCYSNDGFNPMVIDSFEIKQGAYVDQNLFECVSSNVNSAINIYFCINTNATNVILRDTEFVGLRTAAFYDWVSGVAAAHCYKALCMVNNCCFPDYNIKNDTFTIADGSRTGNWECLYGVGWSGNMMPEIGTQAQSADSGDFLNEFAGLRSYCSITGRSGTGNPTGARTTNIWYKYVNQAFGDATAIGAGGGDYHKQSSSPTINPAFDAPPWLPFDLDGNARGLSDPPGAYSSANPRKGGFF